MSVVREKAVSKQVLKKSIIRRDHYLDNIAKIREWESSAANHAINADAFLTTPRPDCVASSVKAVLYCCQETSMGFRYQKPIGRFCPKHHTKS
jgi:hypothetical protein